MVAVTPSVQAASWTGFVVSNDVYFVVYPYLLVHVKLPSLNSQNKRPIQCWEKVQIMSRQNIYTICTLDAGANLNGVDPYAAR